MVNGHRSNDHSNQDLLPGETVTGAAGIGSRAIPAPVTSIPKLMRDVITIPRGPQRNTVSTVSHVETSVTQNAHNNVETTVTKNVTKTHYNLQRGPTNYVKIGDIVNGPAAEVLQSLESELEAVRAAVEKERAEGLSSSGPEAQVAGETSPPSPGVLGPGSAPKLHVLRQVIHTTDVDLGLDCCFAIHRLETCMTTATCSFSMKTLC